jgi:quinol monooxygenase YgiN
MTSQYSSLTYREFKSKNYISLKSKQANMEKQIQVLVELTISEGKVDEFKTQMPAIIERVKKNEPDMIGYQWYLSDDQTKCYVIEWLKNSQAWLIHLSNVEQIVPALFAIAPITRLEVFGDISKDVEDAFRPFGAVIYKHLSGFIRQQYISV